MCEDCLLKCQAQQMYKCPYCRVKQQTAAPSNEYKLLKLLIGVKDPAAHAALVSAMRSVARREEGAMGRLDAALGMAVPHMEDFHSQHYESQVCVNMIEGILGGQMTIAAARVLLTSATTEAAVEKLRQLEASGVALHHMNEAPPFLRNLGYVEPGREGGTNNVRAAQISLSDGMQTVRALLSWLRDPRGRVCPCIPHAPAKMQSWALVIRAALCIVLECAVFIVMIYYLTQSSYMAKQ